MAGVNSSYNNNTGRDFISQFLLKNSFYSGLIWNSVRYWQTWSQVQLVISFKYSFGTLCQSQKIMLSQLWRPDQYSTVKGQHGYIFHCCAYKPPRIYPLDKGVDSVKLRVYYGPKKAVMERGTQKWAMLPLRKVHFLKEKAMWGG